MTFGEKLRDARVKAGMTQEELAQKLCVSRSAIAKWESDKGMPDITNIKAVAGCLNVSIDYLLDDGTELDLNVTRTAIEKGTGSHWKDETIRRAYPDAEIVELIAQQSLTKGEKAVDLAILLLTPLVDMVKLSKQLNNVGNTFYLVTAAGEQYLCLVTDEFMETRRLSHPITEKRFELGDHTFTKRNRTIK